MTEIIPTHEEMLERARKLVPNLIARAAETERLGQIHPDSIREMKEAGIFKILLPRAYGGYEMSYSTLMEVAMELGRGCCSTGWVCENNTMHNLIMSFFSKEMQDEFWGDGNEDRLCATGWSSFHSKLVPVDGGYRASGHWEFHSGVHNCEAVMLLAPVEGRTLPSGAPEMRLFVVYKESGDYELEVDSWNVVGLAGTGSVNGKGDDMFIPEHRTMRTDLMHQHSKEGDAPLLQGAGVHKSAWHHIGLFTWFPHSVAPCLIGAAQGAIDHTIERLEGRTNLFGTTLGETQAMQLRIAEASAKVEAARALHLNAVREMEEHVERGVQPSWQTRGRWRGNAAYSAVLAYEAVTSLFYRGGAHGIYMDDRLQRIFRDVGAGATHVGTDWELAGKIYGMALQGLDTSNIPLH